MKKIFLLFLSLFMFALLVHVQAQNLVFADFENKGTDQWCENRITSDGSSIAIVDNPLKTDRNSSDKVYKISDIVSAGAICLDLRTYYSGGYHDLPEENVIDIFNPDGTLKYDKVSIKYYAEGNVTYSSCISNISMKEPEGARVTLTGKTWDYTLEQISGQSWTDWNTVTFDLSDLKSNPDRLQFFAYHVGWGNPAVTDVNIYVDEIVFHEAEKVDPPLVVITSRLNFADFEGNGTDRWCEKRITEQEDGKAPKIAIVDNPLKTERNNSNKVMKLTDFNSAGAIYLNMTAYGNAGTPLDEKDQIDLANEDRSACKYTKMSVKYYIKGNYTPSYLDQIKIQFLEYTAAQSGKVWTYPLEKTIGKDWTDWNTVTFDISNFSYKCNRVQLLSYYVGWNLSVPVSDVEVYIDDITFFTQEEIPPAPDAASIMIGNFEGNGTDRWCSGRLVKDNDACTATYEIVDNPLKEEGTNESEKVLKISNVNMKGMSALNLARNVGGIDQIKSKGYTALRMKYYIPSAKYPDMCVLLKPDGAEPRYEGRWSDRARNWRTVTFNIDPNTDASWLQLFLYYSNDVNLDNILLEDLDIYLDDIELLYPEGKLNGISVDDAAITTFDPEVMTYAYNLPYTQEAGNIPEVTYTLGSSNQTVNIVRATNLAGNEVERTTVLKVMTDGQETSQYRVVFNIMPKMDIYLCLGQSNMNGYGYFAPEDDGVIENTYLFNSDNVFEEATNPFNRYSTTANTQSRISPSYGFAKGLIGKTDCPIGLIVNGRNASAIEQWEKSYTGNAEQLYQRTLERAKAAQKWGDIKGIIWHQGCSNSNDPEGYKNKLNTLVTDFRTDLGDVDNSQIFFIAGQLGAWRSSVAAFNQMITTISTFVENADWVSSEGLTPWKDESDPHFDRESNILLGERYAEKVIAKYYAEPTLVDGSSVTSANIYVAGKQATISSVQTNSVFSVFDVSGRKLITEKIQAGSVAVYTFDSNGVYIVTLEDGTKVIKKKVLVK